MERWQWDSIYREERERMQTQEPSIQFSKCVVVIQPLTHVRLFMSPWTAACQAPLSPTICQSWLQFMSIESVMLSNHLMLCHPLLLLPSLFPSIRVISNELALPNKWPEYWSFSFGISPFNEYSGLISFRIDWFDLHAVQGLSRVFSNTAVQKHHPWHSRFFMIQCPYLYMIIGKTIALIIWTFVGKVMTLLFSMLSRFVIAFLPKSKHLLISWLQSPFIVILVLCIFCSKRRIVEDSENITSRSPSREMTLKKTNHTATELEKKTEKWRRIKEKTVLRT